MEDSTTAAQDYTKTINFKPSFVIIAIDTHATMFEKKGEENHSFKEALQACYEIADSLIFAASKSGYNQFGVVLINEDDENCNLIEVQNNLLETVKKLKTLSNKTNDELESLYKHSSKINFAEFLLFCKKKFKQIDSSYYKRNLIFLTNNDNPVEDAQKKFAALNEAKTLKPFDISFELVTMKRDFDYGRFFNEFFHVYDEREALEVFCEDKDGLVEKLSSSIVYRYTKLRYNFYPFQNDHTRFLKILKVNYIKEAKLYNTDRIAKNGKTLSRIPKNPQGDIPKNQTFVLKTMNKRWEFDVQEKFEIYGNNLPLGLHLLQVSDRITEEGVCIDQVSLMFEDPKEDVKYFDQFWQYCVDNGKVLICLKKYRNPFEVRYVELVPKYANKQKLFLIKDIPFCNELKTNFSKSSQEVILNSKQHEVLDEFLDLLTFTYNPKMFVNPSLNKKKEYVKSKMLDEDEEEVEDVTMDTEGIDERMKETVEQLKRAFQLTEERPGKRKAKATSASGGRGKKAK